MHGSASESLCLLGQTLLWLVHWVVAFRYSSRFLLKRKLASLAIAYSYTPEGCMRVGSQASKNFGYISKLPSVCVFNLSAPAPQMYSRSRTSQQKRRNCARFCENNNFSAKRIAPACSEMSTGQFVSAWGLQRRSRCTLDLLKVNPFLFSYVLCLSGDIPFVKMRSVLFLWNSERCENCSYLQEIKTVE